MAWDIKEDCRTVGELKRQLEKFPNKAELWGYEGTILVRHNGCTSMIDCPEGDHEEDDGEEDLEFKHRLR